MYPDGRAAQLMRAIQLPCAHCGGAVREPLTLAAKRHGRDPRAVLTRSARSRTGGAGRGEQVALAAARAAALTLVRSRRGRTLTVALTSRDLGRPDARCASRTRRCSAARAGSSTTSRPSPHACHAASCARSSRTPAIARRRDGGARAPGVVGVLTGDGRGARSRGRSRPRSTSAVPHYAAAVETARYVGEPLAVVVARDRYLAEDAAELVAVDYEPLDARARPGRGADAGPRPHLPLRRRRRGARRRRPRRAPDASASRASPARRSSATASSATGTSRPGRLTAWANFQGPFTPARRRRGRARPARRPAAPADAARLGRLVRDQVVGASRTSC